MSDHLVVDASATVAALIGSPDASDRLATLDIISVPDHWFIEVVNSLRGLSLGKVISTSDADEAFEDLRTMRVVTYASKDTCDRIWELRHNLTAHDAAYVALAEHLGVPLLTGDARISKAGATTHPIEVLA